MHNVVGAWRRERDMRAAFACWRGRLSESRCAAGQAAIAESFHTSQLLARAFGGWARRAARELRAREHAASVLLVPTPMLGAMGDENPDVPPASGVSVLYGARLKASGFRQWRAAIRYARWLRRRAGGGVHTRVCVLDVCVQGCEKGAGCGRCRLPAAGSVA